MAAEYIVSCILVRHPDVLLLSVEHQLLPVVRRLLETGCDRRALRDILSRCPEMLSCCVETHLDPILAYFKSLEFQDSELAQLVSAQPAVLVASLHPATKSKIDMIRGFGFEGRALVTQLLADPGLLGMAVPNLRRKWDFLVHEMGLGLDDVREYPRYFSHSLLHETGPRFSFVKKRGVGHLFVSARGGVSLTLLLGLGEQGFMALAQVEEQAFKDFCESWNEHEGLKWCGINAALR